jgi:hypothetical protein
MYKIEYDVKIHEGGIPYIDIPEDYENNPEDRLFVLDVSRYLFEDILHKRRDILDDNAIHQIENAINLLRQIGDEVAVIIYQQMRNLGETEFILNNNYHLQVNNIEERDALPLVDIQFGNKIFDRREGLKVLVVDEEKIYILTNGIENENWTLIQNDEI